MTWPSEEDRLLRPVHFFISYSPLDELWATWIAWQLETAGYRTMLQAWDFVAGSNFIDFMDRGVSQSVAVIAVLSRHYMRSRYGRMEWQAALRSTPEDPAKRLITVRVDDSPLEGLLSTITFVDLVALDDAGVARERLLRRIDEALGGRAKPVVGPEFPGNGQPVGPPPGAVRIPAQRGRRLAGRPPVAYPPTLLAASDRTDTTILHLRGPMFGKPERPSLRQADDLFEMILAAIDWWVKAGGGPPDMTVVTGRLTRSGGIREFDEALNFLIQLRLALRLEPHRLAVVPGGTDITRAACRAYFANCDADEIDPQPPYWPKWRHFSRFFRGLYEGIDTVRFDEQQPWTLFEMNDLRVVVAGINSTMADSHEDEVGRGLVGSAQARWFGQHLRRYGELGWMRVAIVADGPRSAGPPGLENRLEYGTHGQDGSTRVLGDADQFELHISPFVEATLSESDTSRDAGSVATMVTLRRTTDAITVDDRPLMSGE
jgi:TIR domain